MTIDRALILLTQEVGYKIPPIEFIFYMRRRADQNYSDDKHFQFERDTQEAIKVVGAYLLGVTP